MININKKYIFPIAAFALLSLAVIDGNTAFADNSSSNRDTIVQKIAEKFNLNQDEVEAVFNQVRSERHAEMESRFEEKLAENVKAGNISDEQKTLILNKHEELESEREANRDSFRDLSREEKRAQSETRKAEFETWASENGIDPKYLFPEFGSWDHQGHGPRM